MNRTVFGATGRTGEPLVAAALAAGHHVVAFVRDPDRLTTVTGDAYANENVAAAVASGGSTRSSASSEGRTGAPGTCCR